MKHTIAVEITQMIEVEAENEDQAFEIVRNQMDPRQAAVARLQSVITMVYDAKTNSYVREDMLNDQSRMDKNESNDRTDRTDA